MEVPRARDVVVIRGTAPFFRPVTIVEVGPILYAIKMLPIECIF